MAKRMTKAEMQGWAIFICLAIPVYILLNVVERVGWFPLIVIVGAAISAIIWLQIVNRKRRREALMLKYHDEKIVNALMDKSFWQGQTAEQLMDSLGKPQDIDQKVLKIKKKEIWKYNHRGSNRYGLRITLDNDIVVGWDQKQ